MYKWSAKQQFPNFKTVGGVIYTIGVPYMQYNVKKWVSSTGGVFCINHQKSKSK